jgi:hypothetical protein
MVSGSITIFFDPYGVEEEIGCYFHPWVSPMATHEDFPFGEGMLSGRRPNLKNWGKETQIPWFRVRAQRIRM